MSHEPVTAVLGAGSWGTAIAIHIAASGRSVMLWGHDPQHVEAMQSARCNARYLPDAPFPKTLSVTADLDACTKAAQHTIIAVPSHAFTSVLKRLEKPKTGISWLTKGLDPTSCQLLSQQVEARWGADFPIGIISGPSFAKEVATGLPTALVLAGNNPAYQQAIHTLLHHGLVRVYESNDIIGVQWCGAVKNIIAIACGVSDGLNFGSNAKAALITRGLAEMSRIGIYLGGRQETFMGLAGVGDLVLTCTDNQSRNRRYGLYIGQGMTGISAEKQIGQVVEGKDNAAQVCALAANFQIEVPICSVVNALLQEKMPATDAVLELMNRPPKEE